MKFEVGEKVLWWDGEFVRRGFVKELYENRSAILLGDARMITPWNCDLYHETPNELRQLKERIDELRYKFENISDELRHKIEEAEHDVQA